MPLTLPTHPIAVVPLKLWRPRWFDGVALAIGAIAPDLGYATYGFGPTVRTHNVFALFWWSVPVTLIAVRLVRWAAPVIAAHLPGGGPLRLGDYGVLGLVRHRWPVTVLSALLGAWSHLAWDWVTHPNYFAALRPEVWPGVPWWYALSSASNVAGFTVGASLILHIGRSGLLRQWHGAPPGVRRRPFTFWCTMTVALGCGVTLVAVFPVDWFAGQAIRVMVITGLALCCGAAAASGGTRAAGGGSPARSGPAARPGRERGPGSGIWRNARTGCVRDSSPPGPARRLGPGSAGLPRRLSPADDDVRHDATATAVGLGRPLDLGRHRCHGDPSAARDRRLR